MKVSSSICPTDLEVGSEGDRYAEAALLEAIREFIEARLGKLAEITCLQVGHRQGDKWARIDGDEEAGEALLADFFEDHGSDEDLFAADRPTDEQIAALEAEAAQHGDLLMAAICRVAAGRDHAAIPLDGGERRRVEAMTADAALAEVARCLREAAAQRDG